MMNVQEAMQLEEVDDPKPAARRRSGAGGRYGGHRSNVIGNGSLDFSSTVERILSTLEQRGDDHPPHHGPLLQSELSKLSMLCAQQQQQQQQLQLRSSSTKKVASSSSSSNDGIIMDHELGFADVDVEMILELVGYLEKHVALASGINIIQSTYKQIQKIRAENNSGGIEEWIGKTGKDLLEVLSSGLEAAAILLFIMTSPGCDRRIVNEDAIAASMVLMKHTIIHNIIPAINGTGHIVAALKQNIQVAPTKKRRRSCTALNGDDAAVLLHMRQCYKVIMKSITGTILLMERLTILIQRVPMDDQHLLSCSAGALATFELDPSLDTYKIQVAAVALVTSIFRQYPKMRESIIQDLFPTMLLMPTGKKSIRSFSIQFSSVLFPESVQKLSRSLLADGVTNDSMLIASSPSRANIQPMSVLILNLVQSAIVRPAYEEDETAEGDDEDRDNSERKLNTGLARCQYVSNVFVQNLMQRCAQKGEDGGASDFRPILSNFIDDLLLVVLGPEYPAAEMILLDIVNSISLAINEIVERKNVRRGEETYINTIFEALGKICAAEARIRIWNKNHPIQDLPPIRKNTALRRFDCYCGKEESGEKYTLNCDRCKTWCHGNCVGISRETQPDKWLCDACQLGEIVNFEREYTTTLGDLGCPIGLIDRSYCVRRLLLDYLSLLLENNGHTGIQDAYKFHLARWLNSLQVINSSKAEREGQKEGYTGNSALVSVLLDMWDPSETQTVGAGSLSGMLQCMSDEGRGRMMVDLITKLSGLLNSFQDQVGFVLKLLKDQNTKIRKLSLRAIEKIADADPTLMLKPRFQKAVFHRFSDEAVSVREAVVSLVGNYVIQSPELANAFHQAFVVGLADPGISVKKRTITVLHSVLCNNPNYMGRAEACGIMLRLAADPKEDDIVRDLVHDLFAKLWLENGDETVQESHIVSPEIKDCEGVLETPTSKVSNMEYVGTSATPRNCTLETSGSRRVSNAPSAWSTFTRSNRSTARRIRNRHLRIRCEVAAEQMVEVVKEADSGEGLTLLFRELCSDILESDKTKKASARKQRQCLAKERSAMLIDALFDILLAVEDDPSTPKLERGKEFVAVFRVIHVVTSVSPLAILKHLDTLLPYLKLENGVESVHEEEIASSLCPIFSRVIPQLELQNLRNLAEKSMGDDLARIIMNRGRLATSSAVEALCLLAGHKFAKDAKVFGERLLQLARTFYSYLEKHKNPETADRPLTSKAKRNIHRALGVMGSICRFFESSSFDSAEAADKDLSLENVAPLCEKMFMNFFEKNDEEITRAALRGMVGIFHAHPKEMLRMEQNGLIARVMSCSSPEPVQLESLHCWRDILLAEEERIESGAAKAKMDSKKNITVSKKISGDQDSDAILCGGILTRHDSRIYEMTSSRDVSIRYAAVDLTGHLLRQGQLNPNDAVPHMLAIQGDVEERIRTRALQIIMVEAQKRPEIVRQHLYSGIKRSYSFQKTVHPDINEVNALITVRKEGIEEKECVFGSVYKECIATIKRQRQSLLQNLVRVFDLSKMTNSTKSEKEQEWPADLELLSYTSQVLAYLPYGYPSDVLFVIHRSDAIITRTGNDLLEKISLFLQDCGLLSEDNFAGDEKGDIIALAAKRHVPHHAKEATALLDSSFDVIKFAKLCNEAGCIILLLRLKSFLQHLYGLSESRCHQFDPNKKTAEKPITKSSTSSVFTSKLPLQGKKIDDTNDLLDAAIFQCEEFRQLMRSEHKQIAIVMEEEATTRAMRDVGQAEESHYSDDEEMLQESATPTSKRPKPTVSE
ncbi:sister chromatid cohesion C-terminus-domain containing protein [Nitzschia inconspicua]|uniref:Sister chromatid cohesion protein n=1 Tax=Nitzschia inconspicua TaxID=303405 RepID=A0A9K3KED0_9STRA|nr:sister chromatid cohesion C-terminus-domain containing protein [Nitzschia inconspicua]